MTGLQIAEWLKTAPPTNVTAVHIEAIVGRARRMQQALTDGVFPVGSVFEKLSNSARGEIMSRMRNLNTVMATTAECARDATVSTVEEKRENIEMSLGKIEDVVSTVCTAVETPLLLDARIESDSSPPTPESGPPEERGFNGLIAAADVDAALLLRQAIMKDDPCRYSSEISHENIIFDSSTRPGGASKSNTHMRQSKLGTIEGHPIIAETYRYMEAPDHSGDPYPQTLQQVRKITGLLCHPKRKGFHILPCSGFFRDRLRQELGLVFELPPKFDSGPGGGFVTLKQLYKEHQFVPLGHRVHLSWALAAAMEHFHRVGWVHKGIRSNNIAFMATGKGRLASQSEAPGGNDGDSPTTSLLGRFDLGNPLLFGFEYSRASDETTYLEEDHSLQNNLYRHPDRWGRPAARFDKSHDVYSLGAVLLEIALWKDVSVIVKPVLHSGRVVAAEVAKALVERCGKKLSHQVGGVFAQCILTCLEFGSRTKGMGEYEAHAYLQRNVTNPLRRAVGRV